MSEKKFPHKCCQCGMCCLSMTCEIGQLIFDIRRDELCHALVFEGDVAVCKLAPYAVPVGDGCCIRARAYRDGVKYDFASLPPDKKKLAVEQVQKRVVFQIWKKGGAANGKKEA